MMRKRRQKISKQEILRWLILLLQKFHLILENKVEAKDNNIFPMMVKFLLTVPSKGMKWFSNNDKFNLDKEQVLFALLNLMVFRLFSHKWILCHKSNMKLKINGKRKVNTIL